MHLVDGAEEKPGEAYKIVRRELEAYGEGLTDKYEIVALNKIDALDPETLKKRRQSLRRAAGKPVFLVSGVSGAGVREILFEVLARMNDGKQAQAAAEDALEEWTP